MLPTIVLKLNLSPGISKVPFKALAPSEILVALLDVDVPKLVSKDDILALIFDNCSLVTLGTSSFTLAITSIFPSFVLAILLFNSSISACTSNLAPTFSSCIEN